MKAIIKFLFLWLYPFLLGQNEVSLLWFCIILWCL